MATKIRKEQIRIEEFIQAVQNVDWTSDSLTASASAILAKIQSEVVGVTGAMLYRGPWSAAVTDTIKKGYVYVYSATSHGSIGTGNGAVILENGDMIIANRDNASISDPEQWTVVNVNITGAVTDGNFESKLYNALSSGNGNALTITNDTANHKIKLTVNFPSVSSGNAQNGKYVSGLSIDPATGAITVTRGDLPDKGADHMVMGEVPTGIVNGNNRTFTSQLNYASKNHLAMYVNGVRQQEDVDFEVDVNSGKLEFTLLNGAYVPVAGDVVTIDYMTTSSLE